MRIQRRAQHHLQEPHPLAHGRFQASQFRLLQDRLVRSQASQFRLLQERRAASNAQALVQVHVPAATAEALLVQVALPAQVAADQVALDQVAEEPQVAVAVQVAAQDVVPQSARDVVVATAKNFSQ